MEENPRDPVYAVSSEVLSNFKVCGWKKLTCLLTLVNRKQDERGQNATYRSRIRLTVNKLILLPCLYLDKDRNPVKQPDVLHTSTTDVDLLSLKEQVSFSLAQLFKTFSFKSLFLPVPANIKISASLCVQIVHLACLRSSKRPGS